MRTRSHDAVRDLWELPGLPAGEEKTAVVAEARCATCKHRREHERERVREMGFINCALLKPWDWIPQESKCRFSPGRWEAK